jgi:acyl dehydratase
VNAQYPLEQGDARRSSFATVMGMSVKDLSEVGGQCLRIATAPFRRPVYPGDTLGVRSTVAVKRLSVSRPSRGILRA